MNLRKIVTMGMATLMAVSAMSLSAFAAEDENINFYNSVQVLTFNSETGSLFRKLGSKYWKWHILNKKTSLPIFL